jgi:hypothetical protein
VANVDQKHPADIADELQRLPPEEAQERLRSLPKSLAAAVVQEFDDELRPRLLEGLPERALSELLGHLRVLAARPVATLARRPDGRCPPRLGQMPSFDNEFSWHHVGIMILRRLGPDPHAGGAQTAALSGCPDIFELENGDFAIVGRDVTSEVIRDLPPGATCGADERIIAIPRKTLVLARVDIPKSL